MAFLRRYPWLGIVAIFFLTASAVVFINKSNEKATNAKICKAVLGNSLLLRDLIDKSLAANPNPQNQQLVTDFYRRIELPPEICHGTGVNVNKFFDRSRTTTTTTPTVESGAGAPSTSPTVTSVATSTPIQTVIVQGPRGPQGPPGPRGPVGTAPSPTTTSTSTTTTTAKPLLPPVHLPPGISSLAVLWSGWSAWHRWARWSHLVA